MEQTLSPYAELAIGTIAPSPTNPRKTFHDLEDLAASIREQGVMQPILARLWPEDYPTPEGRTERPLYEIIAGERRYRASLLAGLDTIPALVRVLNTRQVLEAQIVENLQRRDVTELEEAEGYQLMMRDHGYTADQLAEKVGKSRAYIYGRLKLCALSEAAREAYRSGKLDASRALLIARIPGAKLQAEAVAAIQQGWGGPMSYRQAAEHIQRNYMLKLKDAPFDTGNAFLLITASDCHRCEKNTANARELFPDVDADVCTDPACWQNKKANANAKRLELAKEAGQRVIEGEAAKKIAPNGTGYGLKGYAKLDAPNYDAPYQKDRARYPTNRDLLAGADVETVLIRDPGTGDVVEAVEQSALAAAMKAAGIKDHAGESKAREREAAAAARRETAYRARLFDEIGSAVRVEINCSKTPSLKRREDLALIARQFWARIGFDAQCRLAKIRIQPGDKIDNHARVRMLDAEMRDYNAGQLIELLFHLALVGTLDIPPYCSDISTPAPLLDTARSFDLDPDAIRAGLDAKPAEKTAPTPPQAPPGGADTAEKPATGLAVAAEVSARLKLNAVPYRHPDNADLTWTGRGRKPEWVAAWLKDGGTLEDLSTPTQAAPARDVPAETPKAKPARPAKQAAPAAAKPKKEAATAAKKSKEKAKDSGRASPAERKGKTTAAPTDDAPIERDTKTIDLIDAHFPELAVADQAQQEAAA